MFGLGLRLLRLGFKGLTIRGFEVWGGRTKVLNELSWHVAVCPSDRTCLICCPPFIPSLTRWLDIATDDGGDFDRSCEEKKNRKKYGGGAAAAAAR